jgi:hypothetical protein
MSQLHIGESIVEASWWWYFILIIPAGIVIRFILASLREYELRCPASEDFEKKQKPEPATLPDGWWCSILQGVLSTHKSARVRDWWLPFIIGLLELTAYPYFIASGDLKPIGGWIALKTVAQWREWTKSRSNYQRFLIGNALVIAAAVFLTWFTQLTVQTSKIDAPAVSQQR